MFCTDSLRYDAILTMTANAFDDSIRECLVGRHGRPHEQAHQREVLIWWQNIWQAKRTDFATRMTSKERCT